VSVQERAVEQTECRFGQPPAFVIRAPGRVNLIGDQTDYNDGFVLPMAINRAIWMALRPRQDRIVEVHALDLDETECFSLEDLHHGLAGWAEYVQGVAWALQEAGCKINSFLGKIILDKPGKIGYNGGYMILDSR
jgi:galactokinase